ncbi:hypothetical protein CR513_61809, partial [Mucuna pruriens]
DRLHGRTQSRTDSYQELDPSRHQKVDFSKARFKHMRIYRVRVVVKSESVLAFMIRKRSSDSLHHFDPEIEKTFNRIRKSKNMHVGHTSDSVSSILETNNFEMKPDFLDNSLSEMDPMENNNNRTLIELATSDVLY